MAAPRRVAGLVFSDEEAGELARLARPLVPAFTISVIGYGG